MARLALSRYVDVGADFEAHRPVVESVSVLFDLYDGDADGYAAIGSPGEPLSTGWMVTAAKFEVEWPTDPDRAALVRSHFGARRKAFNWGLAQVKADLDAKTVDPGHESVDWDLSSLRVGVEPGQRHGRPVVGGQFQGVLLVGFGRSGTRTGQLGSQQEWHA